MTESNLPYGKFVGALITSQIPYAFMIFCGFFFGKVGLIQKEGLFAFSKMNIEIFLPIYLFIQVCRSTYTYNFEENGVIIISFIFYFVISFIICFIYCLISKMDLRYRFTFILLTSVIDVKRLHYLYINSYCYLLENKLDKENTFCNKILDYSYIHVFFQGLVIWFIAYNLIKMDKAYENQAIEVWDNIHIKINTEENDLLNDNQKEEKKDEEKKEENIEKKTEENELLKSNRYTKSEIEEAKNIYNSYAINNKNNIENTDQPNENDLNKTEEMINFQGRQSFYSKISKYQKIRFFQTNNIKKELLLLIFNSPFIGLIIAFIVGFIRVIREWIYDTTTPVYLFFDTFNTIGNCNILLGFLMVGANLFHENTINKKNSNALIRIIDYIIHLIIKVIILPFLGIVFCYVVKKKFIKDNKVLIWACFIQWLLPSSIDIMAIAQVNDANCKFVAFSICFQLVFQMLINNFVQVPTFLKMMDIL